MDPYKIISSKYIDDVETRVSHYMADGWLPTGGIAIVDNGGGFLFYQAIFNPAGVNPAA